MKKFDLFYFIVLVVFIIVAVFLRLSEARDRCQDYLPDIRAYGVQYNGLDFPWWYNVGCAMTETNCRGDIISFDGGIGLFQFTPSTGVTAQVRKYIPLDPYNTKSSIRGQSYYMMMIRTKTFKTKQIAVGRSKGKGYPAKFVEKCGLNLADVYRFYNGGYWFFYEAERGGRVCDNVEMRKYCVRGGVWTGTGKNRKYLDFCDVNYSYPDKVYKFSQKYKIGADGHKFYYSKEQPKVVEVPKVIEPPKIVEVPKVVEPPVVVPDKPKETPPVEQPKQDEKKNIFYKVFLYVFR